MDQFISDFRRISQDLHQAMVDQGFWDKERNDSEALMLIVCELAEAVEGLRHGNPPSTHIPKFSAVEEELADVIIRLMDLSAGRKWDVAGAFSAKVEFNRSRPKMHGKKF